jgi:rhamnose transport system substrate-binding protein
MEESMKRAFCSLLGVIVAMCMILSCTRGTRAASGVEGGANAFVFKGTGFIASDLMFQGFKEVMDSKGEKSINQASAEPTVTAQVQVLDELITQGVKSISVSTNGDQGYDRIVQNARDAGIVVFSTDSALPPALRVTHVNPTTQASIGSAMVQAAVLIQLRVSVPADTDLAKAVETALPSYAGPEINFGILSAAVDMPVQNGWIAKMREELQKDVYKGKVSQNLDIKYGNDVLTESTTQANAFISENKVDVIISPTSIGLAAAAQALAATPSSKIKVTGLGIPSEMQSLMPLSPSDNEFSYVCPYMLLWDFVHMGRVLAGAVYAATEGTFDGSNGSSFQLDAYGNYPAGTYRAENDPDGNPGTVVISGGPFVFHKGNMADWISVM